MSDMSIDQCEAELQRGLNTYKAFQYAAEIIETAKVQRQTESERIARLGDLAEQVESATDQLASVVLKLDTAKAQANDIISSAKTTADGIISDAQLQAKSILDGATARLQEIQTIRDQIASNADALSTQVSASQIQLTAAQKQLSDTIAVRDDLVARTKIGLGI